jgi:hypothetical protein
MKIKNINVFINETFDLVVLFWMLSPFVALAVSAYSAILPKYALTHWLELIVRAV